MTTLGLTCQSAPPPPPREYWRAFGPAWFARWQVVLLALLAEPVLGRWLRWLLCITPDEPGHRGRIVRILPHAYVVTLDRPEPVRRIRRSPWRRTWTRKLPRWRGGTHVFVARTHWKFSKRIYYAGRPLWWLLHGWDWAVPNKIGCLVPYLPGRAAAVAAMLAISLNAGFDAFGPAYPSAGSVSPVDGRTQRSGVNETFGTIRDGAGTTFTNTTTDEEIALLRATTTTDQYQDLYVGHFLFDTSSMGAGATVSAATLSLAGTNKANGLGDPELDVAGSTTASDSTLAAGDHANRGRTAFGSVAYADWTTTGAYIDIALNASGLAHLNPAGTTKFSTQLNWDLDDSFTGSWVSGARSRFTAYMADQTGTTNDPKLEATFTPAQQGLPTADYSTTSWTQGAGDGDGSWFDELDEGVDAADDATTYWTSGNNPSSLAIAVTLGALTDPGVGTGHVVRVRWRCNGGSRTLNATIELLDSDGTSRASFSQNGINGTTAWTTTEHPLSEAQANAITGYASGLKIRVTAATTGGGSGSSMDLSAVDLIIPASTGDQAVTGGTIAAGSTLFAPSASYDQPVTGGTIAAGSALSAPSVLIEQAVTGGTIPAGSALSAPSLAYRVAAASVASTLTLFAPSIAVGAVDVTAGTIAAGSTLSAPTISQSGGAQAVTAGTVAAGSSLSAPSLVYDQPVTAGTIAAGSTLAAPSVATGAVSVTGAHLASTLALTAPSLAHAVTAPHIASGAALSAPTVALGPAVVTAAHVASGVTLFAPTVAGDAPATTVLEAQLSGTTFRDALINEDHVVAAYEFKTHLGTHVRDIAHGRNPGTYVSASGFTRGVAGDLPEGNLGVECDGVGYVEVPDDGDGFIVEGDSGARSLSLVGGSIGIALLVKTTTNDATLRALVQKQETDSNGIGWHVGLLNGRPTFRLVVGAGEVFHITDADVIADGETHVVIAFYNPSLGSNNARVYIDGAISGTQVNATTEPELNTGALRFGAFNDGAGLLQSGTVLFYAMIGREANTSLASALEATRVWTDLSEDVLQSPPEVSWGIRGQGWLDRIAAIGTLQWEMKNTPNNSGGVHGYYTLDHANVRTGWVKGAPIRLTHTVGGDSFVWRGMLAAADPGTGQYRARPVRCLAEDWMAIAAQSSVFGQLVQTNVRSDQAWLAAVDMADRAPIAVSVTAGVETFPFTGDQASPQMTVAQELARVSISEGGYTYLHPDGTLVFEPRTTRQVNKTPVATFSETMHELTVHNRQETIVNVVPFTITPRAAGASDTDTLYETPARVRVGPGQTVRIQFRFQDPTQSRSQVGGTDFQPLIATMTADSDGGGVDLTSFLVVHEQIDGSGGFADVSNTHGTQVGHVALEVQGRVLRTDTPLEEEVRTPASVSRHGARRLPISYPYLNTAVAARNVSRAPLALFEHGRGIPEALVVRPVRDSALHETIRDLTVGDPIALAETMSGITAAETFFINGVRLRILPVHRLEAHYSLFPSVSVDEDYLVWDPVDWDEGVWGF